MVIMNAILASNQQYISYFSSSTSQGNAAEKILSQIVRLLVFRIQLFFHLLVIPNVLDQVSSIFTWRFLRRSPNQIFNMKPFWNSNQNDFNYFFIYQLTRSSILNFIKIDQAASEKMSTETIVDRQTADDPLIPIAHPEHYSDELIINIKV